MPRFSTAKRREKAARPDRPLRRIETMPAPPIKSPRRARAHSPKAIHVIWCMTSSLFSAISTSGQPRRLLCRATDHVPDLTRTDAGQIDLARPALAIDETLADQFARLLADARGRHVGLAHQSRRLVDRSPNGAEV